MYAFCYKKTTAWENKLFCCFSISYQPETFVYWVRILLYRRHWRFQLLLMGIDDVEKGCAFTQSNVSLISEQLSRNPLSDVLDSVQEMSHWGTNVQNELTIYTQDSLYKYDTQSKHKIGLHTTQFGKECCQRHGDLQRNYSHFVGDWSNIEYFSETFSPGTFPLFRRNHSCILGPFCFKIPKHNNEYPCIHNWIMDIHIDYGCPKLNFGYPEPKLKNLWTLFATFSVFMSHR